MIDQSSLSRQYVTVIVTVRGDDPTGNPVQFAFTLDQADPLDGDWQTASWSTTPGPLPGNYIAQCLIGPGGTIALGKGEYAIWVKITASPEVPVIGAGTLQLT